MRRFLIVLICLSFLGADAQYVAIPDVTLRQVLQQQYPAAFNASGLLNISPGAPSTYIQSINLTTTSVNDFDGLQYFTAATTLTLRGGNIFPNYYPPLIKFVDLSLFNASATDLELSNTSDSLRIVNCPGLTQISSLPPVLRSIEVIGSCPMVNFPELNFSLQTLRLDGLNIVPITGFSPSLNEIMLDNMHWGTVPDLPSQLTNLRLRNMDLTSLPELPFTLRNLDLRDNQFTGLPPLPEQLSVLSLRSNLFTSLPELPPTLQMLDCAYNNISILPTLPETLESLAVDFNPIVAIPNFPSALQYINASNDALTSLPDEFPPLLTLADFSHNQLTSLPAVLPQFLSSLYVDNNQLTVLPPFNDNLSDLVCDSNHLTELPALSTGMVNIVCHSNNIRCFPHLEPSVTFISMDDKISCLPNLTDWYYIKTLSSAGNWTEYSISSGNFYPICNPIKNRERCQAFPLITGKVFVDENSNNVFDQGETIRSNIRLSLSPGHSSYSNTTGYYEIAADTIGIQTLNVSSVPFYNIVPQTTNFNFDRYDTVLVRDIALQPLGVHDSLNILLIPTSGLTRPNTQFSYYVRCTNFGTTTLSPNIDLQFNDILLQYDSVSIFGITNTANHLQLSPVNLAPGSRLEFIAYFRIKPTAVGGQNLDADIIAQSSTVSATDSVRQIIISSFDPNDKLATDKLYPTEIALGKFIEYTIRFQNTGTDTAFNIVITDTLSADVLPNTLEMLATSHTCRATLDDNKISFEFLDINLPDSNVNEPKSHGFVQFKIKPRADVPINTDIPNTASIYFDYNTPVVTNTAITHIANPSVPIPLKLLSFSVSRTEKNNAVAVWNTANEYNLKGYTLEMSGDGRNYQPLQFTKAKNQDYNDYHEQFNIPSAEVLYFRLKMADKDGTITYSNVVVLRGEKSSGFVVMNNPVKGDIRVSVLDDKLIGTEIKLINSQGIVVYKGRISGTSISISTATYSAGVYILNTEMGNQKIVVTRN
jgi:uncharacterized repeat protein (TIGR01451 family)